MYAKQKKSNNSVTSQAATHAYALCAQLFTVLLMLFFCNSFAAAQPYRGLYIAQQQCKDTQNGGRELYVGEFFTRPGQCIRVQCLGTLELWEDNCLVPRDLKGDCTQIPPANEYLDYPKCCPIYECKTYEQSAQGKIEQTNTYDHYGTLRKSHLMELIVVNNHRPGAEVAPRRQYKL